MISVYHNFLKDARAMGDMPTDNDPPVVMPWVGSVDETVGESEDGVGSSPSEQYDAHEGRMPWLVVFDPLVGGSCVHFSLHAYRSDDELHDPWRQAWWQIHWTAMCWMPIVFWRMRSLHPTRDVTDQQCV